MSGYLPGGLLGIQISWEMQRDTVSRVQQAPCIGMHQPPSTCAEVVQSNLVWDGLKHPSGPKDWLRLYRLCRTGRAPEGQCTGTGKVVKEGQENWRSPLVLAVMCICTVQAEAFK